MIAKNYRKYPEAAALQLPLPFPHRLTWATSRPTTRLLRAIRAARGAAFKLAGRIAYPTKPATPQWWKEAKAKARTLQETVKAALMPLALNNTELERLQKEHQSAGGFKAHLIWCRIMKLEDQARKAERNITRYVF